MVSRAAPVGKWMGVGMRSSLPSFAEKVLYIDDPFVSTIDASSNDPDRCSVCPVFIFFLESPLSVFANLFFSVFGAWSYINKQYALHLFLYSSVNIVPK